MTLSRLLTYSFLPLVVLLFFYSFTQVDLSLTLSQASILQTIQKSFQEIGYFQRPVSTALFVLIVLAMFGYYMYFLIRAHRKKINKKDIFIVIGLTAVILAFSYNAFSYDLFNYIFDAKIITFYNQNPYLHKALDFPADPMLSFMRWTHRYYPYGPLWLVLTTPLSYIGMNIFLVTFFLFKFLIAGMYLGSVYLVYKVSERINRENALFNTIFFALNPLIIIESLVSAHNDTAMIFFALLGVYLFFAGRKILSLLILVLSALVKIPTVVLVFPVLLSFVPIARVRKLIPEQYIWLFVVFSLLGIAYSVTKIEIQPWYFLWAFPFIALLKPNRYVIAASIGFSLGLLLRYSVLFYYGNWEEGIALPLRNGLTIACTIVPLVLVYLYGKLPRKLL